MVAEIDLEVDTVVIGVPVVIELGHGALQRIGHVRLKFKYKYTWSKQYCFSLEYSVRFKSLHSGGSSPWHDRSALSEPSGISVVDGGANVVEVAPVGAPDVTRLGDGEGTGIGEPVGAKVGEPVRDGHSKQVSGQILLKASPT